MAFNADENEYPIADMPGALERMGGDRVLLAAVVRFFFEDHPAMLEKIREAVAQPNAHVLERSSHALKGLASNFGVNGQVYVLAAGLEQMGREKQFTDAAATLAKLEAAVVRLKAVLEPYSVPEMPGG